MTAKDQLKKLIDELPEAIAGELLDFAEFLRQKEARRSLERGMAMLNAAPADDEPDTDEERAESRAAWDEYRREGGVRLEDLRAELEL
ncbi:MAG: DUF2281 domain-containing protein [Candidatus Sericytochromatia bacterium]